MASFDFRISRLFSSPILKITPDNMPKNLERLRTQKGSAIFQLCELLDKLGMLSSEAQRLHAPITSTARFRDAVNQFCYILSDPERGPLGEVLGFIKVGIKRLYLFDLDGNSHGEMDTPCILDFFVHESVQREGHGKYLFDYVLKDQGWSALGAAIDRPSKQMLGFMAKHYELSAVIPQPNHFVIFEGFFEQHPPPGKKPCYINQRGDVIKPVPPEPRLRIYGQSPFRSGI